MNKSFTLRTVSKYNCTFFGFENETHRQSLDDLLDVYC
jgi:Holliday junction resolvasome RuvABC DNA-binding subunit